MALRSGTLFGTYEILTLIGSGGMGEVYKAHDSRLNRDVAIKVLPPSLTQDSDLLARFSQEARTAAALNHPNILTVHEIGSHDRSPYLVFELLAGQTLREVLQSQRLPVRKALEYARQIAAGLAAAHASGVIHRDLKPENIFITKDGRVKILDFGLAKFVDRGGLFDAPISATAAGTAPGTVLGTVGYMSPEQVRGQALDYRSDIFSFGAILYEMLAGERAFGSATPAETISAILTAEPPSLHEHSAAVPESLDRLIRHCLAKSPDERFQSSRDLIFALPPGDDDRHLQSATLSTRERFAWIVGVACLLSVVGVFFVAPRWPTSAVPQRITIVTTGRTTISQLLAPEMRSVFARTQPAWNVEVRSTVGGSVDGIKQLERGEANLGFVNSVVAFHAVKTDRVLGRRSEAIAGVTVLWGITAQVFAGVDSPIRSIDDLKGKRVSIGIEDSGDRFCSEIVLDHFGLDIADMTTASLDPERAIHGVSDGSLDAGMLWRGVPAPEIERGFETGRLRLLPLDRDALQSLHVKNPFLAPFLIPARIYPHQQTPVSTVRTRMLLVASTSLGADVVETVLRRLSEHIRDLIAVHPAAAEFLLDRAPTVEDGMSIDLHPGAERFFRAQQKR